MKAKQNGSDIEAKVAGRRRGSWLKAHQELNCSSCGDEILCGDKYEHSVTQDRTEELKLCYKCAQK